MLNLSRSYHLYFSWEIGISSAIGKWAIYRSPYWGTNLISTTYKFGKIVEICLQTTNKNKLEAQLEFWGKNHL